MNNTRRETPERLDSWKAIAQYLQRDERTVQRWERELGLPVRRVSGGRGRSVFAYVAEIDAWLKVTRQSEPEMPPPGLRPIQPEPLAPEHRTTLALVWRLGAVAAVVMLMAVWLRPPATVSAKNLRVEMTPEGLVALDGKGSPQWRYEFPPTYKIAPAEDMGDPTSVIAGAHPAIYVATAYRDRRSDGVKESGVLTRLDTDGRAQLSFSFTDTVSFDGATYGPPWIVTSFAVDEAGGTHRVAVAAHHAVWDASLVTVLDEQFHRRGTFVHAGWIEDVRWLSPSRLLIGGFSNAHEGGMVALLDPTSPHGIDGQGPEPPGTHYYCDTCAADPPLRMVVMPRTELNRATASRFNAARIQVALGRIFARTVEVPESVAVDALYEFTPSLDLIRASFSDHYWELRSLLVTQGKLRRTGDLSSQNGPRDVLVWERGTGWRPQKIRKDGGSSTEP